MTWRNPRSTILQNFIALRRPKPEISVTKILQTKKTKANSNLPIYPRHAYWHVGIKNYRVRTIHVSANSIRSSDRLCRGHSAMDQLTLSQAECGKIGSHLVWHATAVSQAEAIRSHPVHGWKCPPAVNCGQEPWYVHWRTSIHGSQCSSLCQDMFLSPVTDPSTVLLCQLRHTVYADTCTDIVTLDCCNSLFACSSQTTLHRLQRVQDAAARLLCGVSPRTLVPPLLKQNTVQTVYFNVWH